MSDYSYPKRRSFNGKRPSDGKSIAELRNCWYCSAAFNNWVKILNASTNKKSTVAVFDSAIRNHRWDFLLLIFGIVAFAATCFYLKFVQDDAYISFRYAANFLSGNGLVFNIGDRVEGYTNFLWVIILAASRKFIGLDYIMTARIFSLAAAVSVFAIIYALVQRSVDNNRTMLFAGICLLILGNLSIAYWTVSGLETTFFAGLVFAAIYFEFNNPRFTPAFLILATLTRPEGGLVFGIILIDRLLRNKKFDFQFILIYIMPLIPYIGFKWLYYGSLLPNPFYAKSGIGFEYIKSGLGYAWHFVRTIGVYGLILVPPTLAVKRLWREFSLLYLYILIYVMYIIWVGGDVLKVYRFLVPVVPVLYFLFVVSLWELINSVSVLKLKTALKIPAFIFICLIVSSGSYFLSYDYIKSYLRLENMLTDKMQFTAGMLKKYMGPDFSVATSTIGMLGYELPGHRVIDLLGLTDNYIARNPEQIKGLTSTWNERRFNSRYILEQRPDFIIFSTNDKPSAPAELALLLHSEFRRCYSPISFPRDTMGRWSLLYKRWKSVNMGLDRVCGDVNFALDFRDGLDYRSTGQYTKSLNSFRSAGMILQEDYPYLICALGEIYYRILDYDKASKCLDYALKIEPYGWHRRLLAFMAREKGDTAEANYQWREIMKYSPWTFDRGTPDWNYSVHP